MEDIVKKLPFIINPNLRSHSPNFKIGWHMIEFKILQTGASFRSAGRQTLYYNQKCEIIVQYNQGQLDLIISNQTNWNTLKLQRWMRMVIRDSIIKRAEEVLPMRLHHWEQMKKLYASKVMVSPKLRKNVMVNCSVKKEIRLAPIIILFPQNYLDEVILHEMAHLKHMHHRKSFWEYLSVLLGKDAKQSQKESCLFLGKYAELFYFIMKK